MFRSMFAVAAIASQLLAVAGAPPTEASAALVDTRGQAVGTVTFREGPAGLVITGDLANLPPGVHAIHVHDVGACPLPDFKGAGGHFNPRGKHHGALAPDGAHAGDLPNVTADGQGRARFTFTTREMTLAPGPHGLLDADGASVVVHDRPDDYRTDPAGDAGGRIACGVIVAGSR